VKLAFAQIFCEAVTNSHPLIKAQLAMLETLIAKKAFSWTSEIKTKRDKNEEILIATIASL
jgi:hypothetical protein